VRVKPRRTKVVTIECKRVGGGGDLNDGMNGARDSKYPECDEIKTDKSERTDTNCVRPRASPGSGSLARRPFLAATACQRQSSFSHDFTIAVSACSWLKKKQDGGEPNAGATCLHWGNIAEREIKTSANPSSRLAYVIETLRLRHTSVPNVK